MWIIRCFHAGLLLDTLMAIAGPELLISIDASSIVLEPPPDAHNTVFSQHGERLFAATQEEPEVRVFGESGRLLTIGRWTPDAVDPEIPAFGSIVADALGHLWVEDRLIEPTGFRRWLIFDQRLALLGAQALPEQFTPFDVGSDYALGRWTREDGAEEVRMYGIARD
jgi:hypothetical protein